MIDTTMIAGKKWWKSKEKKWEMKVVQYQPDEKHLTARALVSKNITLDVHGAVARGLAFQYGLSSRTGVDALLGFSLLLILFYALRSFSLMYSGFFPLLKSQAWENRSLHWFTRKLTSEERAGIFHTDYTVLLIGWKFASSNQTHYPDSTL